MRKIIRGQEAREAMADGVSILAECVSATFGPQGRFVTSWKGHGIPVATKDGVSAAKEVVLEDPARAAGAELVKAAAKKVAEEAGDGTTTTTVLSDALVREGLMALSEGVAFRDIRKEYLDGLAQAEAVLASMKRPVASEEDAVHVASVSADDAATGKAIGSPMWSAGKDALATVEMGTSNGVEAKESAGYRFDKGWLAPQFVADPSKLRTTLKKCAVYVTSRTLSAGVEAVPIFQAAADRGFQRLLMVVGGMEGEALATSIFNRQKGAIDVVAVKAPSFGERREEILGDIAAYVGGAVHGDDEPFRKEMLGTADIVEVDRMGTGILGGGADPKALEARKEGIRTLKGETKSEYDRKELQGRLEALEGKAVTFTVGGQSETEALELRDRVDDAVLAVKAAMRGGVLPGRGKALLVAHRELAVAFPYFASALLAPATRLMANAGLDLGGEWLNDLLCIESPWGWCDEALENGDVPMDLYASGIIDPFEATVSAIRNAVAAAIAILGTEVLIVEVPEKKAA